MSLSLWVFISCRSHKALFVVLPDTQTYLEAYPEVLESQFNWISDNHNMIDALIHVGDLTQDNHPVEWMLLSRYFSDIEEIALPYTFSLGNHDMGSKPGLFADQHDTSLANRFFPVSRFKTKKEWGGSHDQMTIDNHYITLRAGGKEWLIMSLEFGPSDDVLDWANRVAEENRDKWIIVNTHAYLYSDSTLLDNGDWWRPQSYGIGKDTTRTVNDGAQIWEKFASNHPNIVALFCGHVLNEGVGTLVSNGKQGNKVYQMLANYQRGVKGSEKGGNGYLRIVTFDRKKGTLEVKTYSTLEDKYHPSPVHNFIFTDLKLNDRQKRH
ncbi:metallophosphoesterase [Dysgonomonadaceae bacterium zrk40]|nr:metallophosphoesterase [Dysgonomonadaceae bacterium zrk40]